METPTAGIEAVTLSDVLNLATWERERTTEELKAFVDSRHAALPDDTEIE